MIDAQLKAKLQKKYGDECVQVVPFNSVAHIQDRFVWGASPVTFPQDIPFIKRCDAEYNPAFIQLITYILVTNKAHSKIYVTKRIAGEERLRDSLALGCGGHINPCDAGTDFLLNGAVRELHEELNIKLAKGTELEQIGTVRDLLSPTSEHLGIVYLATAATVSVKERDALKGEWMDLSELMSNYSKFESWARYIIDHIFEHQNDGASILNVKGEA